MLFHRKLKIIFLIFLIWFFIFDTIFIKNTNLLFYIHISIFALFALYGMYNFVYETFEKPNYNIIYV